MKALNRTFQEFFKQHPYYVAIAEFDRKTVCHVLRVKSGPPPFPDEWGVLIGEIAHNLRSALDGLAWQLALLKCSKPCRFTAFPIYRIGRTKRQTPQFWGKPHGLRRLQSIDNRFWTRIESFQPYKRRNGGRFAPLFLLQELNNADKHRLIAVVTSVAGGIELTGLWGGGSTIKVGMPLHLNAKIGDVPRLPADGVRVLDIVNGRVRFEDGKLQTRIQHDVQVETKITPEVRFGNSCHAVKGLPVVRTLCGMAREVSRIVDSFSGEF